MGDTRNGVTSLCLYISALTVCRCVLGRLKKTCKSIKGSDVEESSYTATVRRHCQEFSRARRQECDVTPVIFGEVKRESLRFNIGSTLTTNQWQS